MAESPTPPDPEKRNNLGAIPKKLSNIPVKMDVTVASAKRKSRKSSGDRLTPPASPTATRRKVDDDPSLDESDLVSPSDLPSVSSSGGSDADCGQDVSKKEKTSVASSPPTRVRAYPNDFKGPFYVFFRSKGKPLNVLQISRDLRRLYSAVTLIEKVGSKLRVSVANAKQANDIARSELFLREWNVYVPSRNVEIVGVVTEESLTEDELSKGVGVFKNSSLPSLKILECRKLSSVSVKDGKRVYSPSSSFRVTFEGSTLPNYVEMGCLRLPVRLFVPRVWTCEKCQQLGHTAPYCGNKARCTKCGGDHVVDACSVSTQMCVYCGQAPHELSSCPTYMERSARLKQSLKDRSRRSYAEMVKKTLPATENSFALLSEEELSSDDFTSGKVAGAQTESIRRNPEVSRRGMGSLPTGARKNTPTGSAGRNPKPTSGCNLNDNRVFPTLPGTQKMPGVSLSQTENHHSTPTQVQLSTASREREGNGSKTQFSPSGSQSPIAPGLPFANAPGSGSRDGLIPFSELVEMILTAFNASESVKVLAKMLLNSVKPFVQQLAANWPIVNMLISFDG